MDNNFNPILHILLVDNENKKYRLSYDLTHLTRESIKELTEAFTRFNELCPTEKFCAWFT